MGLWYNNKGNWETNIKKVKSKIEGALQTVLYLLNNHKIKEIKLEVAWTLVDVCLIPIILYGTETMILTKTDITTYNGILLQILKRILNVPVTTPNEGILIETGYKPLNYYIERRKLTYVNRIKEYSDDNWVKKIGLFDNSE